MDDFQDSKYTVYIQTDDQNRIITINSSGFITDTDGWIFIDKGSGDKYHHAQNNYLPLPLLDENGVYKYKYTDGAVTERTEDERAADIPPAPVDVEAEQDEAISELTYELTLMQLGMEV